MPPEKFSWINFLNESCTWETKEEAEQFLSKTFGNAIKLTEAEVSSLSELESYMREQLASIHFGRKLDFEYTNRRLSKLKLHLNDKKGADNKTKLPSLSPLSSVRTKPLQQLLDSVLFQFAYFLGETIDGEPAFTVARCEALCKSKTVEDCRSFYKKFRSLEISWRKEVLTDLPNSGELERCADFFISAAGTKGTKFCSDACRFNSFAVRKQLKTPDYQREKQRRYRERQKSKSLGELKA